MSILPDALKRGLRVVFVGTAPSETSRKLGVPYGNGRNLFWPTLSDVGLLPNDFDRRDWRDVTRFGIGITDVCKTQAGIDAKITAWDVEGLWRKLERFAPRFVAFTSRRSAREGTRGFFPSKALCLGEMGLAIAGMWLYGLTSPSPRAAWAWDVEPWIALPIIMATKARETEE